MDYERVPRHGLTAYRLAAELIEAPTVIALLNLTFSKRNLSVAQKTRDRSSSVA